MIRYRFSWLLFVLVLLPVMVSANNTIVIKQIKISKGNYTLAKVLDIVRKQSGCVFSYDPTRIIEKQSIVVKSNLNCALQKALTTILPSGIQFKIREKYIVLQKSTGPAIRPATVTSIKPKCFDVAPVIQSEAPVKLPVIDTIPKQDTVRVLPEVVQLLAPKDSIPPMVVAEVKKPISTSLAPKRNKAVNNKSVFVQNLLVEVGIANYNKLYVGTIGLGYHNLYSIVSFGRNSESVKSRGFGFGGHMAVYDHWGAGFEVLNVTELNGKTYDLGIRTELTTMRPLLYYSIGKTLKLYGGPTFNMFNSRYIYNKQTYNLGKEFFYSYIVGVKIDILSLAGCNN